MPYLTDKRKDEIDRGGKLVTAGDLTYAFTMATINPDPQHSYRWLLKEAIAKYMPHEPRYENFAIVIGSLVATGYEYERRIGGAQTSQRLEELQDFLAEYYTDVIAPYEDEKIKQNGDAYETDRT